MKLTTLAFIFVTIAYAVEPPDWGRVYEESQAVHHDPPPEHHSPVPELATFVIFDAGMVITAIVRSRNNK